MKVFSNISGVQAALIRQIAFLFLFLWLPQNGAVCVCQNVVILVFYF